jgi:hypothetical protein
LDNESTSNHAAAALIADSALFKASGKLESSLNPFRAIYGEVSEAEIEEMMSGCKVVYQSPK